MNPSVTKVIVPDRKELLSEKNVQLTNRKVILSQSSQVHRQEKNVGDD